LTFHQQGAARPDINNNIRELQNMPHSLYPYGKKRALQFEHVFQPVHDAMNEMQPLEARGNRPLRMNFEDRLRVLVYFHLQEHTSAQHLLQELEEDEFARQYIAPADGIRKSSFSEATNTRGLDQFMYVFEKLQGQAVTVLPYRHHDLGPLVAVDGSLITATLSMYWADYRKGAKKAKTHIGFDLNRGIPRKIFLTHGKGAERPLVGRILAPGDTGVIDRGYQCHEAFDQWQEDDLLFLCRIKAKTVKTVIEAYPVASDSIVFYDALVLLGTAGINQTKKPLRVVGYEVDNVRYWIATNRYDLSAEQVATAYKRRWDIENFFAWWKRHLKVYHLIARSEHGLMVQILAGLITYLLLAIYCHKQHNEKVSIKRVRQLRIQIQNELRMTGTAASDNVQSIKKRCPCGSYAKT
jgi:IS4 transposase